MRLRTVALLAAAALAPAALLLWPHLPPLHEDEILPLTPLFLLRKVPEAYGGGFLAGCPRTLFGVPLPLTSYVIEGPIKAIPYALAYPVTRWAYAPEHLVAFYRASNLPWTWLLYAVILLAAVRLGGTRAAVVAAGLLAADVALVYLGVTDLGRPLHLVFGVALALVVAAQVERPRPRSALTVALVVLLGEWDRADFLWFVAAGFVGLGLACLVTPPRRWLAVAGPVLAGTAVGLVGVALLVPEYARLVVEGAGHRIPLADVGRLGAHLQALLYAVDPLGSFQRHFDVGARAGAAPYVAYRRAWVALAGVASAGLVLLGLRERRGALLVFAAYPVTLLALVVVTAESYLVHHVLVVKPFLYVGLAVLAARSGTPGLVAGLALVAAAASVEARAFADVVRAPVATGIYGVTWNASEAWTAAARADVPVVIAVDFGVWVPGALASPPTQRWESTGIGDAATLDAMMARHDRLGFVVRANGPDAWLLGQERYPVIARTVFDAHPGDAWAFLALGR